MLDRLLCLVFALVSITAIGQDDEAFFIKSIYDHTLTEGVCHPWLSEMCTDIGGRLSGSDNANKATDFVKSKLLSLSLDTVYKQPCMVPAWERGDLEIVKYISDGEELSASALGNSIGTGGKILMAEVIEVQSLDEVRELGREKIMGKIVFYNRPMDPKQLTTFSAYGGAVDQRVFGATVAAEYGGVAALVRSMTLRIDDHPHTGVMSYKGDYPKIPGLAISTLDADELSKRLAKGKVKISIQNDAKVLPERESYNVIGEIKGTEFPEEIILVGGHLDSWDIGQGAHDDGAGCAHVMQVMHTLKKLNYKPKRTIRCVLFMNEENGLGGGNEYAKVSNEKGEYHLAALESDAGGFTPRGFTCEGDTSTFKKFFISLNAFEDILSPYNLYIKKGGGGADIRPLKSQKGLLIGFRPDSQRYFDYHHTAIDKIDAVNKRELELGAAAITSLVYLIDQHGL